MGTEPLDAITQQNAKWLDAHFGGEEYVSHQPIWGYQRGRTEGNHVPRIYRTLGILDVLARCRFDTLLDVGGCEGYLGAIIRDLFGAKVVTADLCWEAIKRGRELFGVPGVACDGAAIPFADESFDAVLCAETIEHVARPFDLLQELRRIARKLIVVTTESVESSGLARRLSLLLRTDEPHADLNIWRADDFRRLFPADRVTFRCQFPASRQGEPRDLFERRLNEWMASNRQPVGPNTGLIVCIEKQAARRDEPVAYLARAVQHVMEGPVATIGRVDDGVDVLNGRLRCPVCGSGNIAIELFCCGNCQLAVAGEDGCLDLRGFGTPTRHLLSEPEEGLAALFRRWRPIHNRPCRQLVRAARAAVKKVLASRHTT